MNIVRDGADVAATPEALYSVQKVVTMEQRVTYIHSGHTTVPGLAVRGRTVAVRARDEGRSIIAPQRG